MAGFRSIRDVANGNCVRCGSASVAGQVVGGPPGVMFYPETSSENPPGTPDTVLFQGVRFNGFACPDCGLAWFEARTSTSAAQE